MMIIEVILICGFIVFSIILYGLRLKNHSILNDFMAKISIIFGWFSLFMIVYGIVDKYNLVTNYGLNPENYRILIPICILAYIHTIILGN